MTKLSGGIVRAGVVRPVLLAVADTEPSGLTVPVRKIAAGAGVELRDKNDSLVPGMPPIAMTLPALVTMPESVAYRPPCETASGSPVSSPCTKCPFTWPSARMLRSAAMCWICVAVVTPGSAASASLPGHCGSHGLLERHGCLLSCVV